MINFSCCIFRQLVKMNKTLINFGVNNIIKLVQKQNFIYQAPQLSPVVTYFLLNNSLYPLSSQYLSLLFISGGLTFCFNIFVSKFYRASQQIQATKSLENRPNHRCGL